MQLNFNASQIAEGTPELPRLEGSFQSAAKGPDLRLSPEATKG